MAKKKVSAPKVSQESKKPAAVKSAGATKKAPASKPEKLEITTLDEAKEHIKKSYPNLSLDLQYTVLSNGHVFYGVNNGAAVQVAENYGLKRFEVKF